MSDDLTHGQKIGIWVLKHYGAYPDCPICNALPEHLKVTSWESRIYTPIIADTSSPSGIRMRDPIVELRCSDCGFLMNLDAKTIGLVDPAVGASAAPQTPPE
jgi:hypothetical protein